MLINYDIQQDNTCYQLIRCDCPHRPTGHFIQPRNTLSLVGERTIKDMLLATPPVPPIVPSPQPGSTPPHTYSNKKPKHQDPKLSLLQAKKVHCKKKPSTQPLLPPPQPSRKHSTPILYPNRYTVLPVHEPHEALPSPPLPCSHQHTTQTHSSFYKHSILFYKNTYSSLQYSAYA